MHVYNYLRKLASPRDDWSHAFILQNNAFVMQISSQNLSVINAMLIS